MNDFIFISYSWIDEKPDSYVFNLISKLRIDGYNAICDVMLSQEQTAINFYEMMSKNLDAAEKVIVVLSEKYKERANSFTGGVGTEYRYVISEISEKVNKYILVSFEKDRAKVLPNFLKGREVLYIPEQYNNLLYKLSNVPMYKFPVVGVNRQVPQSLNLAGEHDLLVEFEIKKIIVFLNSKRILVAPIVESFNRWGEQTYSAGAEPDYVRRSILEIKEYTSHQQIEKLITDRVAINVLGQIIGACNTLLDSWLTFDNIFEGKEGTEYSPALYNEINDNLKIINAQKYFSIVVHNANVVQNFRIAIKQSIKTLIAEYNLDIYMDIPVDFDEEGFKLPCAKG